MGSVKRSYDRFSQRPASAPGTSARGSACELEGVIPGTYTAYHVRGSARRGPQVCGVRMNVSDSTTRTTSPQGSHAKSGAGGALEFFGTWWERA
eukprot:4889417-Prymnesium_polylepis.1